MGIFNNVVRGLVGVCLYVLLGSEVATGQTLRTFDVFNGDFELSCGAFGRDPQGFVYTGQCDRGQWQNGSGGLPSINGRSLYVDSANDPDPITTETTTDFSSTLTVAETQDATFVFPYSMKTRADNGDQTIITITFRDGVGSSLGDMTTGLLPSSTSVQTDSMTHPFIRGTLPPGTQGMDITMDCVPDPANAGVCGSVFDDLGPIAITVNDGAGGGDTGGGDVNVDVTLDTNYDVDLQDVQNAIDYALNLQTAVCDAIPDLSGLAFVPDAWGGAGIGGQIAQIQQGIKDACLQEQQVGLQTETATQALAQTDALTGPDPYTRIPSARVYADPLAPSVGQNWENFTTNYDAGDDLVSATVRQTEMLRASTSFQMAQWDRAFGNGPRLAYETERGPKIDENDLASEPNIEFAEGNYGQTYGRLSELVDADQLEPDFGSRVDLEDAVAAYAGPGQCFLTTVPPPSGSGLAFATSTLQWNAANKVAATPLGEWICGIIDQQITAPAEICIGQENPIQVGGTTVAQSKPMCIYGSNAAPWWNYVWQVLPGILMLLSGVAVFKMFF